MKRVLVLAAMAMMTVGLSFAGEATGWIVDEKCASGGKSGAGHSSCAENCIKGGQPAVLVTEDGTVHKIANQDKAVPMAGKQVKVSYEKSGEAIEIKTIAAAD